MFLKFLFYLFLIYLAYKVIFDFILPVYRTSRKLKKGFREMQERMNQHSQPFNPQNQQEPASQKKSEVGDYIDFEEIK